RRGERGFVDGDAGVRWHQRGAQSMSAHEVILVAWRAGNEDRGAKHRATERTKGDRHRSEDARVSALPIMTPTQAPPSNDTANGTGGRRHRARQMTASVRRRPSGAAPRSAFAKEGEDHWRPRGTAVRDFLVASPAA